MPEQKRSWSKVEAILDAADAMLAERSYEAVVSNPADICVRAGVTMGTFYTYFANADAVLEGLRMRWIERMYEMTEERLGPPFQTWTDVTDATVDFCADFFTNGAVRELWLRQGLTATAIAAERRANAYVGAKMRETINELGVLYVGSELDDLVAVEILDQLTRFAYRLGSDGKPDPAVLDRAKLALRAFVHTLIRD